MKRAEEFRVRLSVDGKLLGPAAQAKRIRDALAAGCLRRIHATFLPCVVGGASAPTLLGAPGESLLERSVRLRLERTRQKGARFEAVYAVIGRGKFASASRASSVRRTPCKRATRKTTSSAT